ncbi:MAG: HD domain-containing protein [Patescibacteria group bacterium]
MESIKNSSELKFAHLVPEVWSKLAEIPRTGWVRRGIENPETVQEHTLALKALAPAVSDLLSEFSSDEKQDLLDILEIHDWAEAIDGDKVTITSDPVERKKLKEEKFTSERDAMAKITESLGVEGSVIFDLWLRFELSDDRVADLARQLDKYQAIEKAYEYEKSSGKPLFKEFADYAIKDIKHPLLIEKIESMRLK